MMIQQIKNACLLSMMTYDYSILIWSKERYTIFPEYHPAAVFYNRKLTDDIIKDWDKIKPYVEKEKSENE